MDTEDYIQQYGATLSEADRRYIRAFGAPSIPGPGAGRNPYTPGLRVADAPHLDRATSIRTAPDLIGEE